MYMTQSEIVDRYVRRGTSITILAELNDTRVDQIRGILTDAGVELPEAKKTKLEYTAVVELMRQLSDERKAGGRK